MDKITDQIRQLIDDVKLGYVATVSSDNTPNLSPKGTIFALDDQHLVFADIRSPQTMQNLKHNPTLEINIVHPLSRKGYRFKGNATILNNGDEFSKILQEYSDRGIKSPINAAVKVKLHSIKEVTSPLYDLGVDETTIIQKWKKHYLDN